MLPRAPRRLLLLDGAGAVTTALTMALVLAPFERYFGLPAATAYGLAGLAASFAAYSLTGAFGEPAAAARRLGTIARVNLGYCALSLGAIIAHRAHLTRLGTLYLVVEIAIVAALARYELIVSRAPAPSSEPPRPDAGR